VTLEAKQAMKHLLRRYWLYWIGKSAHASDSQGERLRGSIKVNQKLFKRVLYRRTETIAMGNTTIPSILITRSKGNQENDNSLFC